MTSTNFFASHQMQNQNSALLSQAANSKQPYGNMVVGDQ